MRRLLVTALAALALVAGAAARGEAPVRAAQATPGTFGIRLVDVPTSRADDPRARQYIIDHLSQGTTIERRVEVFNNSSEHLSLELYPAAATIENGEFRFGDGHAANDLTGWTTVDPPTIGLDPGQKHTAKVTIAVPADATSGERYAVIWAQAAKPGGQGVSEVNRVGVRIYLSVGEGQEPPSDFTIDSLTAARDDQRRPIVRAQVHNTGQRALDLSGDLKLDEGPGGLSAGPFALELGTTLAPGKSAPARVVLDPSLPDGPWHAVITVRSGTLEHSAEATITFPSGPSESSRAVPARSLDSTPGPGWVIAATVLALLVALGLLFFFLWSRRRRRDEEDEGQEAAAPTA